MKYRKTITALLMVALLPAAAQGQERVRFNQVGMYPNQEKVVVVEGGKASGLVVKNKLTGRKHKVKTLRKSVSQWSKKTRTIVDLSTLTAPGTYTVSLGNEQHTVIVAPHALQDITCSALKSYYLMRSGVAIDAKYAKAFARPVGHADTRVIVHPSAASLGRPAGSVISSPKGWYDAGDYNKYIVNSAFSIGLMLYAYEMNTAYFNGLNAGIPESGNQTADLLDELMFNLQWMLTMQDPYDGGVYHKLTTPNFEGFVMPSECHQKRYVVQKSVTASYDFAAVMAQAARIFKGNKDYPAFSECAARAAMAAYHWGEQHPEALYIQEKMNERFQPAVSTGTYGDTFAGDEQFWAATELYRLTADEAFFKVAEKLMPHHFDVPTWGNVASLGTYGWLSRQTADAASANALTASLAQQLTAHCDSLIKTTATSCFQTSSGNSAKDFGWGCLAENFCANAIAHLFAYRITGEKRYLTAAMQEADYVLGRNATGFCYVTGFGEKSPQHPHQRLSAADGVNEPMPGLLVGGPNPGMQDNGDGRIAYPSSQPDEAYADDEGSYASNEIAINWNASLVAMLGWLDNVME